MGKSDLKSFLEAAASDRVVLTFRQVEILLGEKLPESAFAVDDWWLRDGPGNQVSSAWSEAGFEPRQVDIAGAAVSSSRRAQSKSRIPGSAVPGGDPSLWYTTDLRLPAYGMMKGQVWSEPDFDPVRPADPDWATAAHDD